MKILVTGADGFIGSHLCELLLAGGQEVRALSQYNSFNNWGWLEDVPSQPALEVITGDIRDYQICLAITRDIDIVFHLAALIAIPYSYAAPDSYVETNIRGTLNICRAARENRISRLVCTSTSEVYGTARYVPIDEKHPLQPQSPYSASKIGADAIALSFYNSFNLPVVIARPFNTFGPRQSARAVIPTIITQLSAGYREIRLGDTSPTRDFNYVEDTCNGMIELSHCEEALGEVVNIGSGREISILDTFNLIRDLMQSDAVLCREEERIRPDKSEVQRLLCDSTKLQNLTGFKPRYSLREGLEKTIPWFTQPANLARYKAHIYNV
jgi:NAD dependent epimerase/dehydratase